MSDDFMLEQMLEVFIFETQQNIEELETVVLNSEKSGQYSADAINEVFRVMHTIKGSAAMMMLTNLSSLAHNMEDLFYFLREKKPKAVDYSIVSDLVLAGVDFIKAEIIKLQNGVSSDGDAADLTIAIEEYLSSLKGDDAQHINKKKTALPGSILTDDISTVCYDDLSAYEAVIYYEDGCEMENIRAYAVVHNLEGMVDDMYYMPADILDNDDTAETIRTTGFTVGVCTSLEAETIEKFFADTLFLRDLEFRQIEMEEFLRKKLDQDAPAVALSPQIETAATVEETAEKDSTTVSAGQSMISVNVAKLDKLMDLVGEMVIAEAMVTQNPDLYGLPLKNFKQAARQLHKITTEIQDMVMSVRMVPLATTFMKMQRVVRDMSKKLQKDVRLKVIGEETEVDKNIIEHISDPLMHLIRNAIDHGLETGEERLACGKDAVGTVTLEARNVGNYVLIFVRDNGRGLDKEAILQRARQNNLLNKPENELTEKEIFGMIFLPGFSTKEKVTEFSGRGVGMDVVVKDLERVGGTVAVDSTTGAGSVFTLKVPLTLAIIEGMNLHVGNSRYTIPISAIRESVRLANNKLIVDTEGNEMLMVRGQCYPIIRLHEFFRVATQITNLDDGIFILVEHDEKIFCLFVDDLLGQQEVVVKALPKYVQNQHVRGIGGCTLLGDGSISLILDAGGFLN